MSPGEKRGRPAKQTAAYKAGLFEDGTPVYIARDGRVLGVLLVRRNDNAGFVSRESGLEPPKPTTRSRPSMVERSLDFA